MMVGVNTMIKYAEARLVTPVNEEGEAEILNLLIMLFSSSDRETNY